VKRHNQGSYPRQHTGATGHNLSYYSILQF